MNPEKNINLLNFKRRYQQEKRWKKRLAVGIGGLGMVVLCTFLAVVGWQLERNRDLNLSIQDMRQNAAGEQKALDGRNNAVADKIAGYSRLKQQEDAIASLLQGKQMVSPLLERFVQMNIEGVVITDIDFDGSDMEIKGYGFEYLPIVRLLYWIQDEQQLGVIHRLSTKAGDSPGEIVFESSWSEVMP